MSGGTIPANNDEGDEFIIDTGGTPETRYIAIRISDTVGRYQTASTRVSESGLAFSIGRAYSTITSFESSEQRGLVSIKEVAVAIPYADSVFDEHPLISGWITDEDYHVIIESSVIDRHKGLTGVGPTINPTTAGHCLESNMGFTVIDGLEVTGATGDSDEGIRLSSGSGGYVLKNLLIHGFTQFQQDGIYAGNIDLVVPPIIENCMIWNINRAGIHAQNFSGVVTQTWIIRNVSIFDTATSTTVDGGGVVMSVTNAGSSITMTCENCVVLKTTQASSACFNVSDSFFQS